MDIVSTAGNVLTVGPSSGTNSFNCSRGPAATKHCVNVTTRTCTVDADCNNPTLIAGSCQLDTQCYFGAPIPVAAIVPACAINTIVNNPAPGGAAGIGGSVNKATGEVSLTVPLQTYTYLTPSGSVTANGGTPCPQCLAGVCKGGKRDGLACTTPAAGVTSLECMPNDAEYAGAIAVTLGPLSTNNSSMAASITKPPDTAPAYFCTGQTAKGAFGLTVVRRIDETGVSPGSLTDGAMHPGTMTSVFCVGSSPNATLNAQAGLPGPGAVSVTANFQLF